MPSPHDGDRAAAFSEPSSGAPAASRQRSVLPEQDLPSISNTVSDDGSPVDVDGSETTSQAAVPAGQTDDGEAPTVSVLKSSQPIISWDTGSWRSFVEKAVSGSNAAKGNGPGNVVLSPISVALALSLAQNGAAGETAVEMAQAMQLAALWQDGAIPEADGISKVLNTSNLALINALAEAAASGDIRLKVANALWYREQLGLLDSFKDASETFYQAQVLGLDFDRTPRAWSGSTRGQTRRPKG